MVLISHPTLLREAFVKPELTDRRLSGAISATTEEQSLAASPYGEHWRRLDSFARHELLSAVNMEMVRERYVEPAIAELVERMGRKSDPGEPVHPNDMLAFSTFDLVVRELFGDDWDHTAEFRRMRETLWRDIEWIHHAASQPDPADLLPWLSCLPSKAFRHAHRLKGIREETYKTLVEHVRRRPGFKPSSPTCLTDFMLAREEAGEISGRVVHDLLMDMMMAHTEGVANTIKFFLLIVANRPEVQSRVQEEMDEVIGRNSLPTVDDRSRLPYTFAAIAECMRTAPSAPWE